MLDLLNLLFKSSETLYSVLFNKAHNGYLLSSVKEEAALELEEAPEAV